MMRHILWILRFWYSFKARSIVVRQATPDDFEDIFEFNHDIFANELGQHPKTGSGRLVDAHHERNTYFIARDGGRIVGMLCATRPGPHGFSVQQKMDEPEILEQYRKDGIELRLLAVAPRYRKTGVFWKLVESMARYISGTQVKHIFISGISTRVGMYRRMGFEPMAAPRASGKATFVPMRLSREKASELSRQAFGF